MATRLYFHDATSALSNLPTAEQSTSLTAAINVDADTVNRSMNTTIGVGPQVQKRAVTGTTASPTLYFTKFVSNPLNQSGVAANTWTYNFAIRESGAAANFPVTTSGTTCAVCYVWRPSTQTKVGTIIDSATGAASIAEATTGITNRHTTFSGSAVASAAVGDVIVFEVWFGNGQAAGTSRNDDFFYDGATVNTTAGSTVSDHASFLETPENIVFQQLLVRTLTDTTAIIDYNPTYTEKLYLRNTTDATSGLPTTEQSTRTSNEDWTSQATNNVLSIEIGTSQTTRLRKIANGALNSFVGKWVTPPLAALGIPSGTWTLNFAARSENVGTTDWPTTGAAQPMSLNIYVWRPSTSSKVATILDGATNSDFDAPAANNSERVVNGTFSGASVSAASMAMGDVVILEIWCIHSGGSINWDAEIMYGGATENTTDNAVVSDHAAFISAPSPGFPFRGTDTITVVKTPAPAGNNYQRTPSTDTISISDVSTTRAVSALRVPSTDSSTVSDSSLTRALSATRVPSTDTATIADVSTTRSATRVRPPSTDSSTITDSSLTRMLSATRAPSTDTLTIGETPTRVLSALRLPSTDSITVADVSITKTFAYTRTGSDTTGVSDSSLTRLLSAIRVPSTDSITVTAGTSTRMLSAIRVPSLDTVLSTEQSVGGKVYGRIPSTDTITIADSAILRLLSAIRSPIDNTISGESLIRILSASRTTGSDTTTVADVSVLQTRSLTRTGSDNTAVVDSSLTRILQASRAPSQDNISISDSSLQRILSALRLVSPDTITTNENITASQSQSILRTTNDIIDITDGTLSRFLSATRVPSSDTVTVADSSIVRMLHLVRTVGADTIAANESISSLLTAPGQNNRSVTDNVSIVDSSLVRLLSSVRTASDTSAITESLVRSATRNRSPTTDSISIVDVSIQRIRSLSRIPTQDTMNIVEASLVRLLSLARSISDTTIITEVASEIAHSRALQDTISVTEPLLQRIVSASRSLNDIVNISEALFYQTYHKFVFDTVVVGEQLFSIRQGLSGSVTYAIPSEVRPLLGNIGPSQRTDDQINLAIDAAYDEINTKTNRIPPNDWKDTDHNFGIVKKLTRYIAAKEMAIGIKDFDTKPLEMEIEHLFNDLLTYDTTSDATQDIVGSSQDETYALNEGGIIWSTRYPNLRKNTSNENSTTINPDT